MIRGILGLLTAGLLLLIMAQCGLAAGLMESYPPTPAPLAGPSVRIALLLPTTGELGTFGRALRSGSVLAFDEWNKHDGVLGRQIEGIVYETDCTFEMAQVVTRQVITDGLQFIIGPLCSEAAIGAAEVVAAQPQIIMLAPTATHPLVTVNAEGRTRPTVFRASLAFPDQGAAAAYFALETLKQRRAALLLNLSDDYSATSGQAFAAQFTAGGGKLVYQAMYPAVEPDFLSLLQAASQAGATILYLPASASTVNQAAQQLNALRASTRITITLLGSDSWESPQLDLTATTGSYFTTHFFLDDNQRNTQSWASAYKAAYAVAPDTLAVLGYEGATILLSAIQQAGTLEVERVAEKLESGCFEIVAGSLVFDRQHNPRRPVPVVQVEAGRLVFAGYAGVEENFQITDAC